MNFFGNRKILVMMAGALIVLSFYDVMLHSIFVVLHTAFEWIELGLEILLEHLFHATRKQSQVVVFYLMMSTAAFLLYRLWLRLPSWWSKLKKDLSVNCLLYKNHLVAYLAHQTLIKKIKIIAACVLGMGFVVFFAVS